MSEDQGRGRADAGRETDPAWLRHEFEQPDIRPAHASSDDPWLRHDASQPPAADPAPSANGDHPAHQEDPADEGERAAAPTGPGTDLPDRPDRAGRPDPAVQDDWDVYAAAAPSPADERDGESDERPAARTGFVPVVKAATKEFVIVIGMALILSFVVKTWLLQAFYIPSGSMEDTLVLNDRVIVSKLTPGAFELKRGDIVVFADPGDWVDPLPKTEHGPLLTGVRQGLMFVGLLPDDSEDHLIKRVIGLPGDHVVCCDEGERITVNGTPLVEPYLKPGNAPSSMDFDITVPAGSVWVMGDHRSDSSDSRYHDAKGNGEDGSVAESLIVGRAVALVWPLDHLTWLSNPKSTFAKVPSAPATGSTPAPATESPSGG